MSIQDLQSRLIALSDTLRQIQQLINRLSKYPSEPGTSSSNIEKGDARIELSTEIHHSLREQEEKFELLRQEIEDQAIYSGWQPIVESNQIREKGERTELATELKRLGEDLRLVRTLFRKAQLTAKRNLEAAKRKEREVLFASVQEGAETRITGCGRRKGQEKLSQDEILRNTSSDVTTSLRRTHALMSSELERSQFARETLENSTKDLDSLSESYTNIETLLSSSRSLLSTLIHSQKSDTWYLESAFLILSVTIGWLLFRRLVYGPGWWLLYSPLKALYKTTLSAIQLLITTLTAVTGYTSAHKEGKLLGQASERTSSSLSYTTTARAADIPTFEPNMPAPFIRAGAGGEGAKMDVGKGINQNLSEQVGEMAEKSQQSSKSGGEESKQGTVLRERAEGEKPNPKKRMWEEPAEDAQASIRSKDEL